MKKPLLSLLVIFTLFFWAGMVAGISFLEAPVKFTAPNITLGLGLGIGRLVFGYLNKCEILFCGVVLGLTFFNRQVLQSWLSLLILTGILAVQSLWLLPALDVRAVAIMAGATPPPSSLHFIYVALELIKFGLLVGTGVVFYKQQLLATAANTNFTRSKVLT